MTKIGVSKRLGNYVQVQDAYGNTYTYGKLAKISKLYAAPKPQKVDPAEVKRMLAAAAGRQGAQGRRLGHRPPRLAHDAPEGRRAGERPGRAGDRADRARRARRSRSACSRNPTRPNAAAAGGAQQEFLRTGRIDGALTPARALGLGARPDRHQEAQGRLAGARRHGARPYRHAPPRPTKPYVRFEVRPAGRGAPRIDPKPILDGWKLLESTAIYRAKGKNPFIGPDAATPTIGQILLMSKETLMQRVLADPRIQVYGCGRNDIRAGAIDRRVLATLEFLVASGFNPTVTSLNCGHSYLTASGNVSEHSTGTAVDIAAVNGIPILGNQGKGSITDMVIQRLITLQGTMKPHQIISLMKVDGTDNTLSMADHADHIHVGFEPQYDSNSKLSKQLNAVLKPEQWDRLIERLGEIDNPKVSVEPSKAALRAKPSRKGPLATDDRRFRFVQWEFAGRLGPPPGRYVVRRYAGDDVREVVVVTQAAAPRRLARREPPGTVARDARDRDRRLRRRRAGGLGRARRGDARALSLRPPRRRRRSRRARTRAARRGRAHGDGRRRAARRGRLGRRTRAPAPEPPTPPRRSKHRPAERLAALMSGRDAVLACEELTLRARGDLRHGPSP